MARFTTSVIFHYFLKLFFYACSMLSLQVPNVIAKYQFTVLARAPGYVLAISKANVFNILILEYFRTHAQAINAIFVNWDQLRNNTDGLYSISNNRILRDLNS